MEKVAKAIVAHKLFLIVLIVGIVLRLFLLNTPVFGIFDESVYVTTAYNMLYLEPVIPDPTFLGSSIDVLTLNPIDVYGEPTLGQDYNYEHPPLAKMIIAGFLWIFSPTVTSYFWARIPSIIFGSIAIISIYGIVLSLTEKKNYAVMAAFILSFEHLFWIQSRVAVLDIYVVGFMLLGMWMYIKGKIWFAIPLFSAAILSKTVGIFGLIGIIIYDLIIHTRNSEGFNVQIDISCLKRIGKVFFGTGILTFILYTVMIQFVGITKNPFNAIGMMNYALLERSDWGRIILSGSMPISQPWNWLFNQHPIRYSWVFDPNSGAVMVDVWGQMSPAIIFLVIPIMVWCFYDAYKTGNRITTFAVVMFLSLYMPYFFSSFIREQFIHHMLLAIPPVVIGITAWLMNQKQSFVAGYLGLVAICWIWQYPYYYLWMYLSVPAYLPPLSFFGG
jgi:predicted membrane-bound dolichyl-phosphate-mannose-protein mannosyltransferase